MPLTPTLNDLLEFKQYPLAIPDTLKQKRGTKTIRLTIAAGGMIFAHNKILLDRSDHSDLWSVPGGTVRFDESAEQSVLRELKEELNLDAEIIEHQPFVYHFEMVSEEVIDLIVLMHFLVKIKTKTSKILIGSDIIDYRWDSIGSHFRDCYPNVKPAVDHFMNI